MVCLGPDPPGRRELGGIAVWDEKIDAVEEVN